MSSMRNPISSSYGRDHLLQSTTQALWPLLIFTCIAGIAVTLFGSAAFPTAWQGASVGFVLTLAPVIVAFLLHEKHILGLGILIVTWTGILLTSVPLLPHLPIYFFLIFPVALATSLIGWHVGLATGLSTSLTLLVMSHLYPGLISSSLYLLHVLLTGSILFASWLYSHCARSTAYWYWQNYLEARDQLEMARSYQGELNHALKDLTKATMETARLNQILDAALWEAEEARRAKAEFAANVSHELRTPLNIILGFSETILNAPAAYGISLPPQLMADVAAIHRNSQHLSQLINDVLDLSQVESHRHSLRREWNSLTEIIQEAVSAIQPALEARGLYLITHIPDQLPHLYCDRIRIRQVILNLLSNASRFTNVGGITVDVSYDDQAVTVTITDTGIGIAEADVPKLFEPFQQLGNPQSDHRGGSGLGLSISRKFIELHGGQIGVRSQLGVGTSVWFTLPVKITTLRQINVANWIVPGWGPWQRSRLTPNIKVMPRMVVLESTDLLRTKIDGYSDEVEIEIVSTVEQLKSQITRNPPQVILVRAESSEQIEAWLTEIDTLRCKIPVVACHLKDQELNKHLGIEDHLLKPITPERLLNAIRKIRKPIRSILVVEDDPDTLQLITRILTASPHRYRVLQATHGQEALELMHLRQPDLVLLDIMIPGMDGLAILAEKNRASLLKDIPVLILSATDPAGQPIVIPYLQVTRKGGLSLPEMLYCAMTIGQVLTPLRD